MLRTVMSCFILASVCTSANSTTSSPSKHVLLIGIDGCRQDAFRLAVENIRKHEAHRFPYFLSLIDESAMDYHIYAGGHVYDKTQQVTTSSPGWTTILTGVWANQHNIKKNNDILYAKMNKAIPTIWNQVKAQFLAAYTVSISDWLPLSVLSSLIHQGYPADRLVAKFYQNLTETVERDETMKEYIVSEINSRQPTFGFVYFAQVDEFGHATGFSTDNSKYMEAVHRVAVHVDNIMQSVETQRSKGQQWLVVVVPDHGGHKKTHGSQAWTDREIFAVFQDPADPRYCCSQEIKAVQGQTTILPTILDYLYNGEQYHSPVYGIPIGKAPTKFLYIMQAAADAFSCTFFRILYHLRFNNTPNGLEVAPGYPRPAGADLWNGLNKYGNLINAVFQDKNGEKIFFFLKNCKYLQFDYESQSLDPGFPKNINVGFPGLSLCENNISTATINFDRTKYLFFMKNGLYISFDIRSAKIDPGFPKSMEQGFPGLSSYAGSIVSCFLLNENYVFVLDDGRCILFKHDVHVTPWRLAGPTPKGLDIAGFSAFSVDVLAFLNVNDSDFFVFLNPMPYN